MKPFSLMLPALCLHLLLLFTFNLLQFENHIAASALGNETDRLALLKFKESISNDPYKILASWNSSSHFCNWFGITCSHRHQRVTELRLEEYNLHGFISPHVGNLSFLRTLSLSNNSFYGKIPEELGRLFRLQILDLSHNMLAGEIFPTNLTSCSELKKLGLSRNDLIGQIPFEIGILRKLQVLVIKGNNLTGQIPPSIGNLSSLIVLSVGENNLEGNIPEEISCLKNLQTLGVVANNLSGTLPSSLYNITSLTTFSIAENQFNGSLPANMFLTLPNLQGFGIGSNKFSGPIPASITNASVLQVFDISNNIFVGPLPSLGKLQDLWLLNLGNNNLGANSTKGLEFLKSLINCSALQLLDFTENSFGGPMPNFVGNLSAQLRELALGGNQISGKIPVELGNLVSLTLLAMESNHFVEMIPSTFGKFHKMQVLALSGNKLSGDIPAFIGNFSQLFYLDLSNNMLEGNIPPGIGNCQKLQYLGLSQNNLRGSLPPEVIGLSSLTILMNLSQNSLSGSLPIEVGRLKNIGKLDVSENHLSGDIPVTIGECMSLEYLYLQGNSFHGIIPSSVALLKGLQHLDLSRNNLSGSIPEGLQNISVLEYLNVSFNMLDGEVPTEGVFKNATALALTANSMLCGGISELHLPPCPVKVIKQTRHHRIRLIAMIVCVISFLLILSFILSIYWIRKRNKKPSSNSPSINQLAMVSYKSLRDGTNGFSARNLIGSGSFGSVYKGSLESEDRVVAIKVLNLERKTAHKSFIAECNAMKNVRHRNLVKILTCCSSTDYKGEEFKALVFEYMTNGSLERWLHPTTESAYHPRRTLDLDQRLNIIIDVACAFHYLHYECKQAVVHCDLKPSNILLDDFMVAHVSDFGLARLLSTTTISPHQTTSTVGIKGTIGYAPPEYGMGSKVSTEGDMYSFGILVLEMLSGRRPTDEMFVDGHNLHNFVKLVIPNNLLQIVDPTILPMELEHAIANKENLTLMHPNVEKCLISLFRIGLACSIESPKERINMVDVMKELNQIRKSFQFDVRSREANYTTTTIV